MFLVALTRGLDLLRAERLLGQIEPKAQQPTSLPEKSEAQPSSKGPRPAKPAERQLSLELVFDEPSEPTKSVMDQSLDVVATRPPKGIAKVLEAEDTVDLLDSVLAEPSQPVQEGVSDTERPSAPSEPDGLTDELLDAIVAQVEDEPQPRTEGNDPDSLFDM